MRLKILLSYWYYRTVDLDSLFKKHFTEPYPECFADSGAYSAFTQGVTINIKEYADWLKRWSHLFITNSNLDVIGSPEGTLSNQKQLEDLGVQVLPVFHTGEDWSHLEHYLEHYPYIALGGMVRYMRDPSKRLFPWLVQAFKRAENRAVFHGFGCTSWDVLKSFKWYSVDSSTWGQGFRFGHMNVFDESAGRFFDMKFGNEKSVYAHSKLFRAYGFDPDDFADRSKNDRTKICGISAISYQLSKG